MLLPGAALESQRELVRAVSSQPLHLGLNHPVDRKAGASGRIDAGIVIVGAPGLGHVLVGVPHRDGRQKLLVETSSRGEETLHACFPRLVDKAEPGLERIHDRLGHLPVRSDHPEALPAQAVVQGEPGADPPGILGKQRQDPASHGRVLLIGDLLIGDIAEANDDLIRGLVSRPDVPVLHPAFHRVAVEKSRRAQPRRELGRVDVHDNAPSSGPDAGLGVDIEGLLPADRGRGQVLVGSPQHRSRTLEKRPRGQHVGAAKRHARPSCPDVPQVEIGILEGIGRSTRWRSGIPRPHSGSSDRR